MARAIAAVLVTGRLAGPLPAVGADPAGAATLPDGVEAVSVAQTGRALWTSRGGVRVDAGQKVAVSGKVRSAAGRPARARVVLAEGPGDGRTVRVIRATRSPRTFRVTHRATAGGEVSVRILAGRPVRITGGELRVLDRGAVAGTEPASKSPTAAAPPVADARPPADSPDQQPTVPTIPPTGEGWRLYWSDEFSRAGLDTGRWRAYHNTYGDGNNELACLTPDNVVVSGGQAAFEARRERITCPGAPTDEYSSGFIGSREAGRYYPLFGRYEIRARIPHGQGLWPAFWLRHRLGADVAEVDVMEYFFSQVPGRTTQTLHFPTTVGRNVAKRSVFTETPVRGSGGWHTWSVEIEPVTGADGTRDVRFRFFIDDAQTLEYVNQRPEAWSADPERAWDIAVNLAVGGDWAGHPDRQLGFLPAPGVCSLTYRAPVGGDPATCPTHGLWQADLPGRYIVDHIRVYTR